MESQRALIAAAAARAREQPLHRPTPPSRDRTGRSLTAAIRIPHMRAARRTTSTRSTRMGPAADSPDRHCRRTSSRPAWSADGQRSRFVSNSVDVPRTGSIYTDERGRLPGRSRLDQHPCSGRQPGLVAGLDRQIVVLEADCEAMRDRPSYTMNADGTVAVAARRRIVVPRRPIRRGAGRCARSHSAPAAAALQRTIYLVNPDGTGVDTPPSIRAGVN